MRMMGEGMHYAGLGRRFFALVIDFVLFCVFFFPITRMVKGVWLMSAADHQWAHGLLITDPLCIIFFVIIVCYFIFLEGLVGATIGKWILGLRVVGLDNKKPGLRRSILRNVSCKGIGRV